MPTPRTTATAVMDLLSGGRNYDTTRQPSLSVHLQTATRIITRVSLCASKKSITIDSETLELMERWLAAYCYTRSDPLYRERETAEGKGVFQDYSFLDGAYALDPSGCLEAIIEKGKVGRVDWLGKVASEETPIWDRD